MNVSFRPGQFYGEAQFGAQGSVFDVHAQVATAREEDVQVHTHQDAHFVLVLSGTYISSALDAGEFAPAPTLIFNPPSTTHRDRFAMGIGTFVTVSLSAGVFCDLSSHQTLACDSIRIRSARALASAFRVAREIRGNRDAAVLESSGWELLANIALSHQVDCPPRWALRAYEAIMDRATEARLAVGDVADNVGVHPVHLARVFREAWGCSPGELLRWRRVDMAADLLRHSSLTGAEIAAEVGFVDQSHMTRAFFAVYGATPGVYRKQSNVSWIQA
jgi:AraC family transcriptional regulator